MVLAMARCTTHGSIVTEQRLEGFEPSIALETRSTSQDSTT